MFTNKWDAALLVKGNAWEAGRVRERVWPKLKVKFMPDRKDALCVRLWKIDKIRSNLWADTS